MISVLSFLAVSLSILGLLLLSGRLSTARHDALAASMIASAIVGVVAISALLMIFLTALMTGNAAIGRLGVHPLLAAVATPLVAGTAAVCFGLLALISPSVFATPADRRSTAAYALLACIAMIAISADWHRLPAEWPGYVLALLVLPAIPSLLGRRLASRAMMKKPAVSIAATKQARKPPHPSTLRRIMPSPATQPIARHERPLQPVAAPRLVRQKAKTQVRQPPRARQSQPAVRPAHRPKVKTVIPLLENLRGDIEQIVAARLATSFHRQERTTAPGVNTLMKGVLTTDDAQR